MFFSPRIKIKLLSGLCRRLATSLGAGIDVRTVWAREAERASGPAAPGVFRSISEAVHRGESLTEALAATGSYFPTLFREMVDLGEQTGQLSEVFVQLAEHYQTQIELRRTFLAAITWPLIQLGAAVVIIGCLILALGVIEKMTGTRVDPLGFGLIGIPGLLVYLAFLGIVGLAFFFTLGAIRRGVVWTRPIQRGVLQLPVLGKALQTMALARLAWSMHLTLGAGMEIRRALRMSVRATRNARYTDHVDRIDTEIAAGNSVYEAFLQAGCFPDEFLDMLAVGEQSGKVVESMARLSKQYYDQARAALVVMNVVGGFAIWALVALILIMMILRLAMFYIGTISGLAQP